jgi:ribonucleotide monophosphatase NagD (HAD superfamily)
VLDPSNAAHQRWLANIDAFIFDIDGVLYTGTGPIDGAARAVVALKAAGKTVRYLTNNSAKTPAAVVATFANMGIGAEVHEVTNSAMVAAEYLKAYVPPGSKVTSGRSYCN